jgi:capsular polysaccharide biosynthesis protein
MSAEHQQTKKQINLETPRNISNSIIWFAYVIMLCLNILQLHHYLDKSISSEKSIHVRFRFIN